MDRETIDPFNFMIADNDFIDFCRIIVALVGVLLFVFSTVRFMQHLRFWDAIALGTLGLLAAFQQVEALGQDLLVWRLPLMAVAVTAGCIYMYKDRDARR